MRLRGFAVLVTALVTAGVAAAAAELHRFGPWRGGCEPTCTLTTATASGARLALRPAADGGIAVAVAPLTPAPLTAVAFTFGDPARRLDIPAARWELAGDGTVQLQDAHDRALVLELLPIAPSVTVAWTTAAGEARTAVVPTAEASAALAWLTEASGHRLRVVDPEAPRVTWSNAPAAFAAAVGACRRDAARALVRVRHAERWTESEDALEVRDAAGAWWRCVARRDGSAVTGWSVLDEADDRGGTAWILTLPPAGPCDRHEVLREADGTIIGLLSRSEC